MLKEGMKVVRRLEGVGEGSKSWWERQKLMYGYTDDTVFVVKRFQYDLEVFLTCPEGKGILAARENWLPAGPTTSIEDWM
jgi:hypothetical protein